jgi:hypothetical protein
VGWFDFRRGRSGSSATTPTPADSALQAVGSGKIVDGRQRRALEARRLACACSIVVDGSGKGTGFLVGKDLVMTNYHVVMDGERKLRNPATIRCRFGFYEADEFADGRYSWADLHSDPQHAFAAFSATASGDDNLSRQAADYRDASTGEDFFDYAILRLATPVGMQSGKGAIGEDLDPLGWIGLSANRALPMVGQRIVVVQFPQREGGGSGAFRQEPNSTAEGTVRSLILEGIRAEHNAATKPGASGGAVFDESLSLIGLHNSGRERQDKTAENRFIPIERILNDIERRKREVYDEIVSSPPPSLKTSGMNRQMHGAVAERVKAAKILLDRDLQHDSILAALKRKSSLPVLVNHVIYRQDSERDKVTFFLDRLRISAPVLENVDPKELAAAFLSGQSAVRKSFVEWESDGITWPDPNVPADEARENLRIQLEARSVSPRTMLVIQVDDVEQRDAAEELEYIKALGEVLSDYASRDDRLKAARQMLQAVVLHWVPTNAAIDTAAFSPLWKPDAAPPHCGVSVALSTVRRNDIHPWVTRLNSAWSLSEEPIAIPDKFGRSDRLSMSEVFSLLEPTISKAAIAVVQRAMENRK